MTRILPYPQNHVRTNPHDVPTIPIITLWQG